MSLPISVAHPAPHALRETHQVQVGSNRLSRGMSLERGMGVRVAIFSSFIGAAGKTGQARSPDRLAGAWSLKTRAYLSFLRFFDIFF